MVESYFSCMIKKIIYLFPILITYSWRGLYAKNFISLGRISANIQIPLRRDNIFAFVLIYSLMFSKHSLSIYSYAYQG